MKALKNWKSIRNKIALGKNMNTFQLLQELDVAIKTFGFKVDY